MLQQIFNDNDQWNFASLPLLNNEVNDKILWRLTANGEYNVKSSYHNVMETIVQNNNLKVAENWKNLADLRCKFLRQHRTKKHPLP